MCVLRVCPPKHLQIEELTSNLPALQALSSSASSVDSMAGSETGSPPMKRKVVKFQGNAKKAMLRWVQTTATKYDIFCSNKTISLFAVLDWMLNKTPNESLSLIWSRLGIEVKDFGRSWRSGVAFHSVIHAIRPDLVDMDVVKTRSNRENLEEAFSVAEDELGIPRLLDPEGTATSFQHSWHVANCLVEKYKFTTDKNRCKSLRI